jgi:hypothetical protein
MASPDNRAGARLGRDAVGDFGYAGAAEETV